LFRVEDLVLEPPGITCVLGPNGAGKSTFLKTLAGAHRPLEGTVRLEPEGVGRAYAPPFPPVGVGLDGWGLLHVITESRAPLVGGVMPPRVRRALSLLGELGEPRGGLSSPLSAMSTGEAMKVMLAGVLASGAEALFLDEPNGHLDAASRARLYGILEREAGGRLVVVSLHDALEAAQVCSRAVVIGRGGDVVWGEAGEVLVPRVLERAYGVSFASVRLGGRSLPLPLLGGEGLD